MSTTTCPFTGHLETYGLGIRIGFYLLWYSIPLSLWIARTETKFLRLLHAILTAATFLGLIIQTDKRTVLRPVEIYITMLLCFATHLYFIPLYIWRALTCCQLPFDPARFARLDKGPIFEIVNFLLLVAVVVFKLWFWFDVVGRSGAGASGFRFGDANVGCQEYGFFFSRVRLDGKGLVVGNILLAFVVLVGCTFVAIFTIVKMARGGYLREIIDDEGGAVSVASSEFDDVIDIGKLRETALQELDTFMYLATVSIVLAAIELTISWNDIKGVNSISSPAQTIPMMFGILGVVRVLYVHLVGDLDARYRVRRGAGVVDFEGVGAWLVGGGGRRRRRRSSRGGSGSRRTGSVSVSSRGG